MSNDAVDNFVSAVYESGGLSPKNWAKDADGKRRPWLPDATVHDLAVVCHQKATIGMRRMLDLSAEAMSVPDFVYMRQQLGVTEPSLAILFWLLSVHARLR